MLPSSPIQPPQRTRRDHHSTPFLTLPTLSPLPTVICSLFVAFKKVNSLVFKQFQPLFAKHPWWGYPAPTQGQNLESQNTQPSHQCHPLSACTLGRAPMRSPAREQLFAFQRGSRGCGHARHSQIISGARGVRGRSLRDLERRAAPGGSRRLAERNQVPPSRSHNAAFGADEFRTGYEGAR